MSSSNEVKVIYSEQAVYGTRNPDPVTAYTARMTDEGLTGTPETTKSAETKNDRTSPGQYTTGKEITGPINFELATGQYFEDFLRAGMMQSAWVAQETVNTTVTLTPDGSDPRKATLLLTDTFANLVAGVLCTFTPAGSTLPVVVQITSVDVPSTQFTVATRKDQAAVTAEVLDVNIPSYVDTGKTKIGFTVGKSYQDVLVGLTTDERSQTYETMLVNGWTVDAPQDAIITGNFELMGTGYSQDSPSWEQDIIANGGTVNPPGEEAPLTGAIDVPLVTVENATTDFCIDNISITLTNNLDGEMCLGYAPPTDYSLGEATVTVTANVYLTDSSYATFMAVKNDQTPIAMTYVTQNEDGGYAFYMPAVQVTFPDPANEGANTQVTFSVEGEAKGVSGVSLRVYRL